MDTGGVVDTKDGVKLKVSQRVPLAEIDNVYTAVSSAGAPHDVAVHFCVTSNKGLGTGVLTTGVADCFERLVCCQKAISDRVLLEGTYDFAAGVWAVFQECEATNGPASVVLKAEMSGSTK